VIVETEWEQQKETSKDVKQESYAEYLIKNQNHLVYLMIISIDN